MEIRFEYTLEDEDFSEAAKIAGRRVVPGAIKNLVTLIVLYVSINVLGSVLGTEHIFTSSVVLGIFTSGLVLGVFGMVLCGVLSYRAQAAKNWKTLPSMHEAKIAIVSTDGLIHNGITSHTKYTWQHFQGFIETDGHLFLMMGTFPILWFPKRVLPASEQESLRQLLQEKLPVKKS